MEATQAKFQTMPPADATTEPACWATKYVSTRSKPWLIGGVLLLTVLAFYLEWDWLAASGAAGLLLSLAPCFAMCALGLCMRGRRNS